MAAGQVRSAEEDYDYIIAGAEYHLTARLHVKGFTRPREAYAAGSPAIE